MKKTTLTKHTVLTWLQNHPLASITSMSPENLPQMAAVYTYVDKKFHCYFITKVVTRKSINLSSNKTISILWYDESTLETCEYSGEAHVVTGGEDVAVAITHLQETITSQKAEYWTPPVGQLKGSQYVVFRVIPNLVSFIDYASASKFETEPERLEFYP